jgi:hypothetical protein
MKRTSAFFLSIAAGLLLPTIPTFAHHSFTAEFDGDKCTDITGTFTKFEWDNPHGYFYLDVKDDKGAVTSWTFETVSLAWLKRSGTTRQDFIDTVGKVVTVRACPAKNDAPRAAAETIKVPGGRTLRVGTDYEQKPAN